MTEEQLYDDAFAQMGQRPARTWREPWPTQARPQARRRLRQVGRWDALPKPPGAEGQALYYHARAGPVAVGG
jgi:hypothetical protein